MAETKGDETERELELRTKRICRFCLSTEEPLTDLYSPENRIKSRVPLPLQIISSVSIEVFTNDGMPRTICDPCRLLIDFSYRFKQMCKKAETALKTFPYTGIWSPKIPLPSYPLNQKPILSAVSRNTIINTKPPTVLNTYKRKIVETVDPIMYNEDGEPEAKRPLNVGNRAVAPVKQPTVPNLIIIKQEASQQSVTQQKTASPQKATPPKLAPQKQPPKQVTSANATTAPKPRILNQTSKVLNVSAKQFKSPDLMTKENGDIELVLEEDQGEEPEIIQDEIFPCTECNRTFMLKQMLVLHMEKHNKERCSVCDYCNKKFFSKYDLTKHMLTHSEVKPFKCTICDKGFTRSNLLSRHEKTHSDQPHYECSFCQKSFLNVEDFEKHELNHRINRPFQCSYCTKNFAFKQGLERHELRHTADQPFKCEYCSEGFPNSSQLARHLTQHAGRRPFPCRLCPSSYLLSHHLTRHIRSHQNANSTFICNNCPETFDSLSGLIAHSEVHAVDEYICPLCKEKLPGPDELSEHIVLHSGEQFACEFCDLIFVEEEQKNDHCEIEHAKEHAEYTIDLKTRKVDEAVIPDNNVNKIISDNIAEFEKNTSTETHIDTKPRRGRPPKVKQNILNYSNNTSENEKSDKEMSLNESDTLMDYEFDYVEVINKNDSKETQQVKPSPPIAKKPAATVHQKKVPQQSPNANAQKNPVSPNKKTSPTKHVPIAQQKLEQQLQNAMKISPSAKSQSNPSDQSDVPKKPILTKVNFKKLPSGVTLKKVSQPGPSQPSPTVPKKGPTARPTTAQPSSTAQSVARGSSSAKKTPTTVPPATKRVKMTQAEVNKMAKEGKIQVRNGQVFLRNTSS